VATLNRQHNMPFGAQPLAGGGVRFRLWAPAASQVELCLEQNEDETLLPMDSAADGWFMLETGEAGPGSRYRFRIDNDMQVPDPASRFQPDDVHGPSEVIDPQDWQWGDMEWQGRPWEETVVYELHLGSFTPEGTFAAAAQKLDYLVELGVTAVELMPVADFPGARNWGYDGALLFAPDSRYGRPEEMKAFIEAAHVRGLMVFLDVVYNHFGPEGNYLHLYAPQFFTERHHTPWGAAINYDGDDSRIVREFFIHNALYWLEEYHLDGLRLDAVHAILDDSQPDILTELAERVHSHFNDGRHIHLVLENDHNAAHYLKRISADKPKWYAAQWNDDIHHALHVLLTGEKSGYYMDYVDDPMRHLARCLGEGFAYQGEQSPYRDDRPRGEASNHLPASAFVSFLQNHDQVGNRAFGERMVTLAPTEHVRTVITMLLLAPSPPLLFMGEEWGCHQPFPFFCDFGPDLADKVVQGRRDEFARFDEFSDAQARARIPDPMAADTFARAVLDWEVVGQAQHQHWLALYRELLALRQREIVPRLKGLPAIGKGCNRLAVRALSAHWRLGDGSVLTLLANLGEASLHKIATPPGVALYSTHPGNNPETDGLPLWSASWFLKAGRTK
jgi:maltooligosyltrehalose trehalohydrolase